MIERSVLGAGPASFAISVLFHYQDPPFVGGYGTWDVAAGHIILYTRIIQPSPDVPGKTQYQVNLADTVASDYAADSCQPQYPQYNYLQTTQDYVIEARAIQQ